jgi:protein PhnA
MNELLSHSTIWECVTCGHEWPKEELADEAPADRVVKDAHGNVLADGDHEISCKMEGLTIALKAIYVKKVPN